MTEEEGTPSAALHTALQGAQKGALGMLSTHTLGNWLCKVAFVGCMSSGVLLCPTHPDHRILPVSHSIVGDI